MFFLNTATDTCRRIQVARPGYLWTVSRWHNNYYLFMSRSTCIPFYPARDGRQTGDNFVTDRPTRYMSTATSGYKWITTCIRQHVSWCKRGLRDLKSIMTYDFSCHTYIPYCNVRRMRRPQRKIATRVVPYTWSAHASYTLQYGIRMTRKVNVNYRAMAWINFRSRWNRKDPSNCNVLTDMPPSTCTKKAFSIILRCFTV